MNKRKSLRMLSVNDLARSILERDAELCKRAESVFNIKCHECPMTIIIFSAYFFDLDSEEQLMKKITSCLAVSRLKKLLIKLGGYILLRINGPSLLVRSAYTYPSRNYGKRTWFSGVLGRYITELVVRHALRANIDQQRTLNSNQIKKYGFGILERELTNATLRLGKKIKNSKVEAFYPIVSADPGLKFFCLSCMASCVRVVGLFHAVMYWPSDRTKIRAFPFVVDKLFVWTEFERSSIAAVVSKLDGAKLNVYDKPIIQVNPTKVKPDNRILILLPRIVETSFAHENKRIWFEKLVSVISADRYSFVVRPHPADLKSRNFVKQTLVQHRIKYESNHLASQLAKYQACFGLFGSSLFLAHSMNLRTVVLLESVIDGWRDFIPFDAISINEIENLRERILV